MQVHTSLRIFSFVGSLALHLLRASALILEALPGHDFVRGLEHQAAVAEAALQANAASRISNIVMLFVDIHGILAGGARAAASVEEAASGTVAKAGLLVEVTENTGAAETPLDAAVYPTVRTRAAIAEAILPSHVGLTDSRLPL